MAGAGFKTFNTGDVLTAADVNTYLMQQTVMVFASSAARTTALGANVAEGMLSYLKDTDQVEVYNGTSWVASDDPNAIQNTIVDAKGDLITATAADTPARLAVGANDTVLTADSSTATGLKWATASGWNPNFTLLNSGGTSLTGGAVTVSFTAKQSLFIYVSGASNAAANNNNYLTFNSDTGSNYGYIGVKNSGANTFGWDRDPATSLMPLAFLANAADTWDCFMWIYGAGTTGWKPFTYSTGTSNAATNSVMRNGSGYYKGSSAITSVTLTANSTTFDAGTIYVYGA